MNRSLNVKPIFRSLALATLLAVPLVMLTSAGQSNAQGDGKPSPLAPAMRDDGDVPAAKRVAPIYPDAVVGAPSLVAADAARESQPNLDAVVGPSGFGEGIEISNNGHGCLDVPGASAANGLVLQQYPCLGLSWGLNQRWYITDNSRGTLKEYLTIRSRATGKCVEAHPSYGDGGPIRQWDCDGSTEQNWEPIYSFFHNEALDGFPKFRLRNQRSGLCIYTRYDTRALYQSACDVYWGPGFSSLWRFL